jgi:signal transduction histidine kinase
MRLAAFALSAELLARFRELLESERVVSKFKTDMLSLVTHEFNNSLAISSLALGVLKESEPASSPRRAGLYDTLERQNKSLKAAVTNFLSFARMEAGRLSLDLRRTPPASLLEETLALIAPLSEQKGLRVERDWSGPPDVRADPDALALVLTNLVGNAVKFTPGGGKVSVRLLAAPDSRSVRFVIEDTGVGMSEEQVSRLRSGQGAAEPVKRPGGGFGLGLRLSRDILTGHGAELRVASRRGSGTSFSFELPVWSAGRS